MKRMQKKTLITPFIFLSLLFGALFPTSVALAANEPSAENPWCVIQQDGTAGECFATVAICGPASGGAGCENYNDFKPAVQQSYENAASLPERVMNSALSGISGLVMDGIALIAEWINGIAAIFLTQMAYILDASIDITIKSSVYANLAVVNIGWTAVRDFSNMFFIFALLYIAILTILGLAGSNTKRWVAHLIIGALLINFSLFATKVVIDAGNVLAVGFWEKLKSDQGSEEINSAAAHFLQGFKIQTVYSNTDAKANGGAGETLKLDSSTRAMIFLGGAIMMFIAGYLFLAGAIMMIVRTVTLILLMIFSPFAFLSFSLPKFNGFAHTWINKLIGSTFVAPAFIFMLYLNALIISSLDDEKLTSAAGSNASAAFLGSAANFAVILNFVTMAILLLSSITVANAVSSGAGTQAGSWSKKLLGYGGGLAVGAAGIAGGRILRQTAGATGSVIAKNKKIDEYARSKNWMVRNVANVAKKSGNAMAKGTWDVRNTGFVKGVNTGLGAAGTGISLQGVGSASKKSYATHGGMVGSAVAAGGTGALRKLGVDIDQEKFGYKGTAREEDYIKIAKERFAGNPEAQKLYLQDRGVQLDEKRNKGTKTEIDRAMAKDEAKKEIKEKSARFEELEKLQKEGKMTPEAAKIEGEEIAKSVEKAMKNLTSFERAEMAEEHGGKAIFARNLSKSDLAQINKLEADGKYTSGVSPMNTVAQTIMKDGGARLEMQSYLMNSDTQGKLLHLNDTELREEIERSGAKDAFERRLAEAKKNKERVTDVAKAYDEAMKEQTERLKKAEQAAKEAAKTSAEASMV